MPSSYAQIPTERSGRYLVQLCKHFAHKVPAEWDEASGHIQFEPGVCRIEADPASLVLHCEADSELGLAQIKAILEDHVTRFGWRESLTIEWVERPDT